MPGNKSRVKNANSSQRNPNTTNSQPSIAPELKEKISNWKEMFPQYKQSTNEDIIAIFDEYNDDFEAAVNGALNGKI